MKPCRTCGEKKRNEDFPLYGNGDDRRKDCKRCWSKLEIIRRRNKRKPLTLSSENVSNPPPR